MRRPRFYRWIRLEVLRLAKTRSFNLRKLAAAAQRTGNADLAASLLLYAHENGQLQRLFAYIYNDNLLAQYKQIEQRLGMRSIERLALRGTPLMSLPPLYRAFLERYNAAYHAPEAIASEKRALRQRTLRSMLETGTTPAELAHACGVDPNNLNAYLARGELHRFTLRTARLIADDLDSNKVCT